MNSDIEILLVEDNEDDIELTMLALKKNRLANTIKVLRDGEEALDYLFCRNQYAGRNPDQRPRVILLDIKLPKVDGLEVLREIKADTSTKCIPVVVMTSSKEQRDMVEGYQLGVNSYIQKPVDFDEFREIIRQLGFYWLVINQLPPSAAFQRKQP
ncbi:MAG TPA: response regulator [Methylomirabilota bacterium]|nr:response regulator [Methylomirabilota bacterium]